MSVHDGDTITVAPCGDAATPVSVRLYGIDAPEDDQPGGDEATAFLAARLPIGAEVELVPYNIDPYDRSVCLVMAGGQAVNGELVRAGHAWVSSRYCRAKFCREWTRRQKAARAARAGLWSDPEPVEPWKWRDNP